MPLSYGLVPHLSKKLSKFPSSNGLSLIFSIAYENSFFFFLALKYPGCSFLNHPNFYPFSQQYFPLKNNSKPSPQIFRYMQDFAHILNSNSKPPFQFSKITFSTTKIKPHSRENSTNQSVFQYHKILKSLLRGIHKISSTTNFLDPSLGETSTKPGMASTSTQNRSHSRETSQNTSNYRNFSKLGPSHNPNYGPKGIRVNLQTTSLMPSNSPRSRIKILISKYYGNLLSFLLRCGTRPYERGTQ